MSDLINATDATYNADSRWVIAKLEIYFDAVPTVITKDDYLIDWDVLEEVGSDASGRPLGNTSANTLTFGLLNDKGIFSPTTTTGPYYGKIRAGIKVIPYIRTKDTNFIQLGVFYVNEWLAAVTSLQATVSCTDQLSKIFTGVTARPLVSARKTYAQAYTSLMDALGVVATIDNTLTGALDWWYTLANNMTTIQALSTASISGCFCGRDGNIVVRNMANSKEVRAILTDRDQVATATVSTALDKEFNGVLLFLNRPQLSKRIELLNVQDINLSRGTYSSAVTQFNIVPVVRVESIHSTFNAPNCRMQTYSANPYELMYSMLNGHTAAAVASLTVYGRSIEIAKSEFLNFGENLLQLDNEYVQTPGVATMVGDMLTRFTESDLPFLDVSVRGNPLLQLGDKITIQSSKYKLNFTGYILRQQFTYTGALRAQIRLINSRILEVT